MNRPIIHQEDLLLGNHPRQRPNIRSAHVYVLCSVLVAFVAIVAPPSQTASLHRINGNLSLGTVQTTGIVGTTPSNPTLDKRKINVNVEAESQGNSSSKKNQEQVDFLKVIQSLFQHLSKQNSKNPNGVDNQRPIADDRIKNGKHYEREGRNNSSIFSRKRQDFQISHALSRFRGLFRSIFDFTRRLSHRAILEMSSRVQPTDSTSTFTQVMDKVLTSTPRLLTIANLLLAVTYLLHSTVADLFLGHELMGDESRSNIQQQISPAAGATFGASTSSRMHRSGRERLGGYLLFKLLLVSAVVEPDTLDLLILLSWYTVLSFLRSLAHLAAMSVAHAHASGQPPPKGVLRLLFAVLICDLVAACVCAALFRGAGIGMVLLLNCDCALLAIDVVAHLIRYLQHALEEKHNARVGEIENVQIQLHGRIRSLRTRDPNTHRAEILNDFDDTVMNFPLSSADALPSIQENFIQDEETRLREESGRLDRSLELLEVHYTSRFNFFEYIAYLLELSVLILTVLHFLHIWSLHGVTFNLVDGVLALHLQSAVGAIGKKIAERRNLIRIARDLDCLFEDASEVDMRKASISGDVCCICLGTMTTGNVKKVTCGHLFHSTPCLKSLVERARSIDLAKCPLCRSSIINERRSFTAVGTSNDIYRDGLIVGPRPGFSSPERNGNEVNIVARLGPDDSHSQGEAPQSPTNQGENSLFRFSTEGILPGWLPLPAFSFEVVRRPTPSPDVGVENSAQAPAENRGDLFGHQQQPDTSFFRRILLIFGVAQMSPEEEVVAIGQLVDMFPQYERADLLRELRNRGSSEAVVESILSGLFLGVER